MVWDRSERNERALERSRLLSKAMDGSHNLPAPRAGEIPGHCRSSPTGSIGGPPIWVMEEAFVPENIAGKRAKKGGRAGGHDRGFGNSDVNADPDGFAVFGRFPQGWLEEIVHLRLLGEVRRDEILHVCSGTLSLTEKWTVDVRLEAKPRVVADGAALPFRDECFKAVLCDPPYSDQYARNLYGTKNPRPSWLLKEAARVVKPGGRVGILHVAIPFAPPACRLMRVYGVSTGVGFRMRAFTVYERTAQEVIPYLCRKDGDG